MANSLFNMMQNQSQVNQQSNQNNMFGTIMNSGNPVQMAMSMLQQQNPNAYNMINQMMRSGMTPQQAMSQLGITPQAINNIQSKFQGR